MITFMGGTVVLGPSYWSHFMVYQRNDLMIADYAKAISQTMRHVDQYPREKMAVGVDEVLKYANRLTL